MIVVRLEAIGHDYETTEQDSGRVVVDGVVEAREAINQGGSYVDIDAGDNVGERD